MRRVAANYPNDLDVQTMYAEALMNTNPWKLWNADGTANPGTDEIVSILQRVIAKDPGHPGANHYYIHAIEASSHPELGVPSAEILRGKMRRRGTLSICRRISCSVSAGMRKQRTPTARVRLPISFISNRRPHLTIIRCT